MSSPILTGTELLRRHFIVAATVLPWLRPDWSAEEAWSKASTYYMQMRPAVKRATLNDEPAYEAGQIAGISGQEVDEQPREFWTRYKEVRRWGFADPERYIGNFVVPNLGSITGDEDYYLTEVGPDAEMTFRG